MTIQLGDKVKDSVTGFIGLCVARTEWISGCARLTLQPAVGKDGKIPESQTFDEPQLRVIKAGVLKRETANPGGPRPEPVQAKTPH